MSPGVDREFLADRAAAVGRPSRPGGPPPAGEPAELRPETAATDTVILHLWQAVQVVINLAVSTCVQLGLASPPTYADAFRRLANAQAIPQDWPSGSRGPWASATLSSMRTGGSTCSASTQPPPADPQAFLAASAIMPTGPSQRRERRFADRRHRLAFSPGLATWSDRGTDLAIPLAAHMPKPYFYILIM